MLGAMRVLIFLCGLSVIALGVAATRTPLLTRPESMGFLTGALALGGGMIIGGLFSLRWKLHGILAAGIMALLGFARGLANLPGLPNYLMGNRDRGPLPALESAVTIICLLLLVSIVKSLFAEKQRRLLADESDED